MAVKKNSGKKDKAGTARDPIRIFRNLFRTVVMALAIYGANDLLVKYVPVYKRFVKQAVEEIRERAGDGARELAPTETYTIRNAEELRKSPYDNLKLGVPTFKCDVILDRQGYALGYSEKYEQPLWVSYKLTADEVKSKRAKREDNFRADPAIPTGSAELSDYRKSHYDRGHLAPAADMSYSVQAMSESFYMSNMSPQKAELNRGRWKELEEKVREWAKRSQHIYVVSGPIFLPGEKYSVIGKNKVAVPHGYYKVVLDTNALAPKAIGFIMPNADCRNKLESYAVTVDAVERATGLDFFSELDPGVEVTVEAGSDYKLWK